jgi:membrane protease YdiL (CAAX protease family)
MPTKGETPMRRALILYFLSFLAVFLLVIFPTPAWLSIVAFLLVLPLAAIWIWRSEGFPLGDLGYRLSNRWLRFFGLGILSGLAIPVLFSAIEVLGGWITLASREETIQGLISYLLPVLIRMILIVAIEEFVFRGFFLNALSINTSFRLTAVLSSLLWGATHLPSMVSDGLSPGLIIIGMASFVAWGITLSLAYLLAENSLWLPYGIHLGVNLGFSLIGWFFITQPITQQWLIGHPAWSPESGLIGVIVWSILAMVLYLIVGKDEIDKFNEHLLPASVEKS